MKFCAFFHFMIFYLSTYSKISAQDLKFTSLLENVFSPFASVIKHATKLDLSQPMRSVVRYYCINRKNETFVEVYMNDKAVKRKLDLTLPVAFIIHGWIDSSKHGWIRQTATDWIKYQDLNVCMVDWSKYSFAEYILASTTYTQIVGHYVAEFIKFLLKNEVNLEETIVVGHSLGGHIAGYIGANLNGSLGTIYGLDPAGPLFTVPVVYDIKNRLDPTDAKYVQVIHSAAGLLGVQINSGHQDFYPNKGVFAQPGCIFPFFADTIFPEPLSCSHFRAVEDFLYSLNEKNQFVSLKCNNINEYNNHNCTGETDLLGIYSKRIPGEYYLVTDRNIPFTTGRFY